MRFKSLLLCSFLAAPTCWSEELPPLPPLDFFSPIQAFVHDKLTPEGCLTQVQVLDVWVDGRLRYQPPGISLFAFAGTARTETGTRMFKQLLSATGVRAENDWPLESPAPAHCIHIDTLKFDVASLTKLIRSQDKRDISDVYGMVSLATSEDGKTLWILEYSRFLWPFGFRAYDEQAIVDDTSGQITFRKLPSAEERLERYFAE